MQPRASTMRAEKPLKPSVGGNALLLKD